MYRGRAHSSTLPGSLFRVGSLNRVSRRRRVDRRARTAQHSGLRSVLRPHMKRKTEGGGEGYLYAV